MRISIITINFNNAKGLERTIRSVQEQTYADIEHIVIDGGSTDGSVDVIKSLESKIAYWVSEPDKGIYNAMNKGVAQARGEYCLFLNSGDILANAEALREVCEENLSSDIVSANLMVDESTTRTNTPPDEVNVSYFFCSSLPHPSTLIKTSLLKRLPYHEDYRIISDWIFFFEALILKNVTYQHIDKFLSIFYTDGISANKDKAKIEQDRFLKSVTPERLLNDFDKPLVQTYISSLYLPSGYQKICRFVVRTCQWLHRHGIKI